MTTAVLAAPANVAADLKLRQGPGTNYRAMATIPQGEQVDVLSCHGTWCEIDWRGYGGYASRSYLSYGFRGRRAHHASRVPLVVVPPPPPPSGPVVYSVPYYDAPYFGSPTWYRSAGVSVFLGF
jgi:uncharacterized protein YraI